MILRLAHLVKPFFLGTMLGFQQIEGFFPSVYETIFNGGSLSQVFFLLVSHISNYSDPNHHIFALHELTVCWNCFWWSTVSLKFPFFCKMKQKLSALVDKSNIWESSNQWPTLFWPEHEREFCFDISKLKRQIQRKICLICQKCPENTFSWNI